MATGKRTGGHWAAQNAAIPIPENFEEMVRKWEEGETELVEVLEQSGLSRGTFYRRYREMCLKKQIMEGAVITVDGSVLRQQI